MYATLFPPILFLLLRSTPRPRMMAAPTQDIDELLLPPTRRRKKKKLNKLATKKAPLFCRRCFHAHVLSLSLSLSFSHSLSLQFFVPIRYFFFVSATLKVILAAGAP